MSNLVAVLLGAIIIMITSCICTVLYLHWRVSKLRQMALDFELNFSGSAPSVIEFLLAFIKSFSGRKVTMAHVEGLINGHSVSFVDIFPYGYYPGPFPSVSIYSPRTIMKVDGHIIQKLSKGKSYHLSIGGDQWFSLTPLYRLRRELQDLSSHPYPPVVKP